jgi:hypothetical protein
MELGRVGAKEAQEMPEKKEARSESEEELISHLSGQSRGRIHGGLINQTAKNPANEPEKSHARATLLCRQQISIKLSGGFGALPLT